MSILLNSSKQAQAPVLARPLKNFPMAMKSSWSEQLNTTHWIAIALARSCEEKGRGEEREEGGRGRRREREKEGGKGGRGKEGEGGRRENEEGR